MAGLQQLREFGDGRIIARFGNPNHIAIGGVVFYIVLMVLLGRIEFGEWDYLHGFGGGVGSRGAELLDIVFYSCLFCFVLIEGNGAVLFDIIG